MFLGMANFYYIFVPRLSLLMSPLSKAMAGKKKNNKVTWTQPLQRAFEDTKAALCCATNLVHVHRPHHQRQ